MMKPLNYTFIQFLYTTFPVACSLLRPVRIFNFFFHAAIPVNRSAACANRVIRNSFRSTLLAKRTFENHFRSTLLAKRMFENHFRSTFLVKSTFKNHFRSTFLAKRMFENHFRSTFLVKSTFENHFRCSDSGIRGIKPYLRFTGSTNCNTGIIVGGCGSTKLYILYRHFKPGSGSFYPSLIF